jgi:hypothetical protein
LNWTEPFIQSNPGLVAGYPDPLLTLFIPKYSCCFHWALVLAKGCIAPSIYSNLSLLAVITLCRVTICGFPIHRGQNWNRYRNSMT